MDYKKEMKKLMKRREAYYPAFEYLLDIYNRRGEFRFPVSIDSAEQVALVLELIDIGYLDKDAFIIKKTRNNVDALYYNGGRISPHRTGSYDGAGPSAYKEREICKACTFSVSRRSCSFYLFYDFLKMLKFNIPYFPAYWNNKY